MLIFTCCTALKDADSLIKDMLTACDIDHDGKISYEEFCRFCTQTEKELWQLFQSIDRDHSGKLDKSELSAAFERSGVAVSNARLDRFFGYIDKNHDGTIDFSEWRGRHITPSQRHPELALVMGYYGFQAQANEFVTLQIFSSSFPQMLLASKPSFHTTKIPPNSPPKETSSSATKLCTLQVRYSLLSRVRCSAQSRSS